MKFNIIIFLLILFLSACFDKANTGDKSKPGQEIYKLYGIIYANKDFMIAKKGDPFPGRMFLAHYDDKENASLDRARQKIKKELNDYYQERCIKDTKLSCELQKVAVIKEGSNRIEIYNCPQCRGSNAPGHDVAGIYHLHTHDDALEIASNQGNPHIGKYDADWHYALSQIQKDKAIITLLKGQGFTWGN